MALLAGWDNPLHGFLDLPERDWQGAVAIVRKAQKIQVERMQNISQMQANMIAQAVARENEKLLKALLRALR